jgi:hypothetical protein
VTTTANVLAGIELGLTVLQAILADLKVSSAAQAAVAAIELAIEELEKVQGTEVTFEQLESLRTKIVWPVVVTGETPAASAETMPSIQETMQPLSETKSAQSETRAEPELMASAVQVALPVAVIDEVTGLRVMTHPEV